MMILVEPGEEARLLRGLDIGVNDYIVAAGRSRTSSWRGCARKSNASAIVDHLRDRLEETVEMAMLDPLTALHNRRYMTSHLETLLETPRCAASRSRC